MKEKIKIIFNKVVKVSIYIYSLFLIFASSITLVQAQSTGGNTGGGKVTFPNPINQESILSLVTAILNIVVQIGAIVAVLFLVYAGFLFVFARGNESMIDKAKQTFFWTIVGGVILLGAFVLSDIIRTTARSLGADV